jgi:hypothetical protein
MSLGLLTETSARFASPDLGFLDFAEMLGKPLLLLSVFKALDPSASPDYASARMKKIFFSSVSAASAAARPL